MMMQTAMVGLLTMGIAAACAADGALSEVGRAAGWVVLFDGSNADAWRGYQHKAFPSKGWVIEDGCLKVQSGGGGGDIITRDQYGDFELVLEFKCAPKANSGIMYRVAEKHSTTWQTGPEYQVLDDAGHGLSPTDKTSAGALYDMYAPSEAKIVRGAGEFNEVRIRLHHGWLEHWLNGVKVVECRVDSPEWKDVIAASKFKGYEGFGLQPSGHIALQDHGDDVWFRNIRVRDLSAAMPGEIALFDGSTMTGWTHHLHGGGAMEDTWRIEDGIIICNGNPAGYIRTENDYTNYVLKLEWRFNPVTKQAGNSGVLLRLIGEDKVWPKSVEAQLMSGNAGDFWNIGDFGMKTDPARLNGRNTKKLRVAERPVGEWNEYEIIVNGGDVRVIVNGDEINHAWDVDIVSGKIGLQSEGAEIHFRNIRLAPLE